MKKLTTILAGIFLLFSASAFTITDADVSPKVRAVFEQNFSSVSDVKWQKVEDVYVASFKDKDNYLTAAYSEEAELLAVARYVSLSQLPLKVSRILMEKYAGYTIKESVVELTGDNTSYLIDAENEKYQLKLKCDASGNFSVMNKIKK